LLPINLVSASATVALYGDGAAPGSSASITAPGAPQVVSPRSRCRGVARGDAGQEDSARTPSFTCSGSDVAGDWSSAVVEGVQFWQLASNPKRA